MAQVTPAGQGDRQSPHEGKTATAVPNQIQIVYDAELKDLDMCDTCVLASICHQYDRQRSYLYLRENSLESNMALVPCFPLSLFVEKWDLTNVTYFDRRPYREYKVCCIKQTPKLEVKKGGCMILFTHQKFCCADKVVLANEQMPPPCCCSSNRVGPCDNCFGILGAPSGNPKVFDTFLPQPQNAAAFVEVAQQTMSR